MQTDEVTVRVQMLNGTWATLGAGPYLGIYPENVVLTANQWGSDTASFTLKRDPAALIPDLAGWTPAEVEIGGVVVWSGRIKETPSQEGPNYGVGITGAGWQYHLDNDAYMRSYVHARLDGFVDQRSLLAADLTVNRAYGSISQDAGIVLTLPAGVNAPANTGMSVILDLGQADAKRVVMNVTDSNNDANAQVNIIGTSVPWWNDASRLDFTAGGQPFSGAAHNLSGTIASPRRYVSILLYHTVTSTPVADAWLKINSVQIFRDTAYESGNASVLKAPAILKDALTFAPLLSQDTSQIDPGGTITFNIPEFDFGTQPRTPREVIETANAFHDYQPYIDMSRRLTYRPRPTAPLYEVGSWAGSEFSDTSMNSTEEIFNNALVTGTDAAEGFLSVLRTTTGTLADRQGAFKSTKILPIDSALTTAVANQIGDIYLAGHSKTPFKGDLTIWPQGVRRVSGGYVHPSVLLLGTGELMRLSNRIDPDTGGRGRDGRIDTVRYTHNERKAEVGLDSSRKSFEAFTQRLSVLTSVRLRQG